MGYDAVRALSNNKSRGHKPAVRKDKHTEKYKEKPTSQKNDMPPKVVDASSATASSISVLEFSMPFNYDGKRMTFQNCVKDHLFPLVKFLPQGDDDTNVEYSLDATTVCGFLRQHCGVSELDAPNWWKEQKKHLRRTLRKAGSKVQAQLVVVVQCCSAQKMVKRAQKDIVFAREITENLQTFYIPGQYDVRLEPHGQIINDRAHFQAVHFYTLWYILIQISVAREKTMHKQTKHFHFHASLHSTIIVITFPPV